MDVLSTVLPQHRVPSLYQRPAALRGARLAVRHAVAEAARSPYFDLSVAERLLHGESEPRLGRRRGCRDHKELVEAPQVRNDVARGQQVVVRARGAAQKRACAATVRREPATRWRAMRRERGPSAEGEVICVVVVSITSPELLYRARALSVRPTTFRSSGVAAKTKDAAIRTELALGHVFIEPRLSRFDTHGLGEVDAVELQTGLGIE